MEQEGKLGWWRQEAQVDGDRGLFGLMFGGVQFWHSKK